MLEIRLLGPVEVLDGGQNLTPRRQKHRALLAALALRAGEVVTPDRLIDDLWGERAPRTAKHALENYVSEVRKIVRRDLIETTSSGYVLRIEREQVDVLRFERLVADTEGREAAERADRLRAALGLIRGKVLADLAFEPFAQSEIARMQELELGAREELVDAELELGRHAEVVLVLDSLVRAHPFRERLRALLMLALYRSGRQADALAEYQKARSALLDELGIDPGEELRELERAILRQDPSLRPPPRPEIEPRPPAASPPVPTSRPARKIVTNVVVGLENYSTLAEKLDAEPLRALLDRFVDATRTAVEGHGGVCGRLAGGEILAVFGIPAAHEDDALRAVRAAVEARAAVGVLNDGLLSEHGLFLGTRMGVTTGEVLVSPSTDDLATGRAVTAAEQLERRASSGQILLDPVTQGLVGEAVEAEEVTPTTLTSDTPAAFRLVELVAVREGRALRLGSPIVGRRRQLAALSVALEDAAADHSCHLFTVLGVAGVGKSRLVQEFMTGLGDGVTVLHGRCLPYGEEITFWPLREALAGTEPGAREMTVDGVRGSLERAASARPLVIVLDDLHWAEAPLLDLVEGFVASSRDAAILVLCIARPELLDQRPTWGGGQARSSSLLLEPLSEAESDRLIDNLLGESDLAEPLRDYVVTTADGNPLFLEELLATLVERDVLFKKAGRWTTTETPAIPLPPTMQALVTARIDRLPPDERAVLDLGSVEGKVFHVDLLAELSAEPPGAIDDRLEALVRRELVRREADGPAFAFRHQVIRDAAYASLTMEMRAELHDRVASWIENTRVEHGTAGAAREDLAGYHREQARRYRALLAQSGTRA